MEQQDPTITRLSDGWGGGGWDRCGGAQMDEGARMDEGAQMDGGLGRGGGGCAEEPQLNTKKHFSFHFLDTYKHGRTDGGTDGRIQL